MYFGTNTLHRPKGGSCDSTEVEDLDAGLISRHERLGANNGGFGPGFDTEHNPDVSYNSILFSIIIIQDIWPLNYIKIGFGICGYFCYCRNSQIF